MIFDGMRILRHFFPGSSARLLLRSLPVGSNILEALVVRAVQEAGPGRPEERLLKDMLAHSEATFSRLRLAALAGALARRHGQFPRFALEAERAIASKKPVRFRQFDHLRNLGAGADQELFELLRRLKFNNLPISATPANFLAQADELASRFDTSAPMTNWLYQHSQHKGMQRSSWEAYFRSAYAVMHLYGEGGITWEHFLPLLCPDTCKRVADRLNQSAGSVLLVCHAGFLEALVAFVDRDIKDLTYVGRGGAQVHKRCWIPNNPNASLFEALKILKAGSNIFIGPDGQQGAVNSKISVLERETNVADGAAFLAYEARCETHWLSIKREQNRFVPVLVAGPRRLEGERFKDYRERLRLFYQDEVSSFFSGHPQNLYIPPRWARVFQ